MPAANRSAADDIMAPFWQRLASPDKQVRLQAMQSIYAMSQTASTLMTVGISINADTASLLKSALHAAEDSIRHRARMAICNLAKRFGTTDGKPETVLVVLLDLNTAQHQILADSPPTNFIRQNIKSVLKPNTKYTC